MASGIAAWSILPTIFRGDVFRPLAGSRRSHPVRVTGRITAGGRGLAKVALSDGRSVVPTDRDGRFALVADGSRPFVSVSVPSGYALPTHPTGTTRCFQRLVPNARGEMAMTLDLTPIPDGDDHHGFVVLADIQTQNGDDMSWFRRDAVPDVVHTVRGLGGVPVFGVGDGDIMWDHLELYADYEAAVKEIGIPFVQVVGNHDLDMPAQSRASAITTFEQRFGPRYYSFNRGQVHYVVLDDVFYYGGGYLGYVDDDQLAWLAADLALVERGSPVVVFAHIPLMNAFGDRVGRSSIGTSVANRDAAYRILGDYQTLILTGHIHENETSTTGTIHERNLGAVCGGWWTGPICYDGTPMGYGVYEAKGREIKGRYQATGHGADHQMRLYRTGADPKAPDEFVANVWSYEPGWKVVWYEEGEPRGSMARRVGFDPLSIQLHLGDKLPVNRPFVDPVPTGHLFYAKASEGAREIRVEATDRFGRTFSDVLRS